MPPLRISTHDKVLLWKVAMGLARLEVDPQYVLKDRFMIGDEDITWLWQARNMLINYNWRTGKVELTEYGKKLL